MPRRILVLVAFLFVVAPAEPALAQSRAVTPVVQQASAAGGRIQGLVRDDIGQAIGGASIVAMGTTLALVRSDGSGQFSLSLPAGEYILRASRDGYVSTYREMVRLQTNAQLEQNITLTRQGVATTDHAHSEAAWRLRHLARTVLRDEAPSTGGVGEPRDGKARTSFFDWAFDSSARAASSFFTQTDFSGQVNFLTTSSVSASSGWLPADMPRGIAYLALSAPVGSYGDWAVRGAITAGDLSSWVLLGEYQASDQLDHAFTVGMSFSAQGYAADRRPRSVTAGEVRNVGGIYGFDHWQIRPGLELDYGLRVDRYDYILTPRLLSPRVGARIALGRRTYVTTLASQRTIAPGADEFLPPTSAGPWLPPERTFSSLAFRAPLKAERVRHLELGVEHEFGSPAAARTIGLRRYRQLASDQVTTLFGLDAGNPAGHYFVGTPGNVAIEGWAVRLAGPLAPRVRANIEYAVSDAEWSHTWQVRAIRRFAPSVVRPSRERLHDLTASFDASIPETATRVSMAYRVSSGFSAVGRAGRLPIADGRFDVQVHQALPYRPMRGSTLELLFALRSLFRDLRETGSIYDELLTVAPPMRLTGGVQVRF